jgi:hypothetical protein
MSRLVTKLVCTICLQPVWESSRRIDKGERMRGDVGFVVAPYNESLYMDLTSGISS